MEVSVTMTKEQWAGVIRLMMEGHQEGTYYVGRDEENAVLIGAICNQSGITGPQAYEMEPKRDYYVPRGGVP